MKDDEIEEEDDNYAIYSLGKAQAEPYVVDVLVSNESLKMEVDTGAAVSVMNEDTYVYITEEKTPKPRAEGIKGKIVPIVKDYKSIRIWTCGL
jgi:hypothetical protein